MKETQYASNSQEQMDKSKQPPVLFLDKVMMSHMVTWLVGPTSFMTNILLAGQIYSSQQVTRALKTTMLSVYLKQLV